MRFGKFEIYPFYVKLIVKYFMHFFLHDDKQHA